MKMFELNSSELSDRLDVTYYLVRKEISELIGSAKVGVLADYCVPVKTKTPAARMYGNSGIPCLKLRNVRGSVLDVRNVDYVSEDAARNYTRAKDGDLLLTATGEGTAGRVDIFTEAGRYLVTGEIILLRPKVDTIDPFYLLAVLRSDVARQQLVRYVRGATGQTHLYWRDIESIPIPLVGADEQDSVAGLLKEAIRLQREAEATSDRATELGQSLVRKALADSVSKC